MPLSTQNLLQQLKAAVTEYQQDPAWNGLFQACGLDFSNVKTQSNDDFANLLAKPITVTLNRVQLASLCTDRTAFLDLHPQAQQGVTRANLAQSILYYIFATPNVVPKGARLPAPSLAALELLEQYVYVARDTPLSQQQIQDGIKNKTLINGAMPPSLSELSQRANVTIDKLAIVTFAQEFRRASNTPHRQYADMVLSRTGIARIGTVGPQYMPETRGYWPVVDGQPHAIAVSPVQYVAYIAVQVQGNNRHFARRKNLGEEGMVPSPTSPDVDNNRLFWVPLHRLFNGTECLQNFNLQCNYEAKHLNHKIDALHSAAKATNGKSLEPRNEKGQALNRQGFPFFIRDNDIAIISNQQEDCSGLLVPQPKKKLVEKTDISFLVPQGHQGTTDNSLFYSSLQVETTIGEGHPIPEYVHIRDDVVRGDLNALTTMQQNDLIGNNSLSRRAFHYVDFTGDGYVLIQVPALQNSGLQQSFPAFSLVAAPDFYPRVMQHELLNWAVTAQPNAPWNNSPIWQRRNRIPPNDLSSQRTLPGVKKQNGDFVFPVNSNDPNTYTAVISPWTSTIFPINPSSKFTWLLTSKEPGVTILSEPQTSFSLPDSAAGFFAPGWDISRMTPVGGEERFSAAGLGSPFPEDAKLCAALSGFWPAAAPDSTLTFPIVVNPGDPFNTINLNPAPVIMPMTDHETGRAPGSLPWDGVPAPNFDYIQKRLTAQNTIFVDYTHNATQGLFTLATTAQTTANQFVRRMEVMRRVINELGDNPQQPKFRLASFQENADGSYTVEMVLLDSPTPNQINAGQPHAFTAQIREAKRLTITSDNAISAKTITLGVVNPGRITGNGTSAQADDSIDRATPAVFARL